eukprot:TRINITY_DN62532_c0_g1_i1.p1 TRINITY_DN62532_c0_g1~~TRINITY_DN62532_c0_g1_i1.p1  ORF type:complete len:917 (-),score=52.27 TRINITY_DN62532_c0_g1_i1:856-3606(-)
MVQVMDPTTLEELCGQFDYDHLPNLEEKERSKREQKHATSKSAPKITPKRPKVNKLPRLQSNVTLARPQKTPTVSTLMFLSLSPRSYTASRLVELAGVAPSASSFASLGDQQWPPSLESLLPIPHAPTTTRHGSAPRHQQHQRHMWFLKNTSKRKQSHPKPKPPLTAPPETKGRSEMGSNSNGTGTKSQPQTVITSSPAVTIVYNPDDIVLSNPSQHHNHPSGGANNLTVSGGQHNNNINTSGNINETDKEAALLAGVEEVPTTPETPQPQDALEKLTTQLQTMSLLSSDQQNELAAIGAAAGAHGSTFGSSGSSGVLGGPGTGSSHGTFSTRCCGPAYNDHVVDVWTRARDMQRNAVESMRKKLNLQEQRRQVAEQEQKQRPHKELLEIWLSVIDLVYSTRYFGQIVVERKAIRTLECLFLPILKKYVTLKKHRQDRAIKTQEAMERALRPTAEKLQDMVIFENWPNWNILNIIEALQLRWYADGHPVAHEGDFGDELYIIHQGVVDIVVRNASTSNKSRSLSNGVVVASLSDGTYFGEFALIAEEPRTATAICRGPVIMWILHKRDFKTEVERLQGKVKEGLIRTADKRRKSNMYKLQPLTINMLLKVPNTGFFTAFGEHQLNILLPKFKPVVFRKGDTIVKEGEPGGGLYIVSQGRVAVSVSDGEGGEHHVKELTHGMMFGELACVFLINRTATCTAMSNNTDLWALSRADLLDVLRADPMLFMTVKRRANEHRAHWLRRPHMRLLKDHALLKCCTSAFLIELIQKMTPKVYDLSEVLCEMNTQTDEIIVIVNGYAEGGGLEFHRRVGDPKVRGPGDVLGLYETLWRLRWHEEVKARSVCLCWSLKRSDLILLLRQYPQAREKLLEATQDEVGWHSSVQQQASILGGGGTGGFSPRKRGRLFSEHAGLRTWGN